MKLSFQIGTAVKTPDGQPMIVIGISPNLRIWCQWEDEQGVIQEGSFAPEDLSFFSMADALAMGSKRHSSANPNTTAEKC